MRRRLLIFAKLPEAGRTKTRLQPRLGLEGAARLYQAFLDDTVEAALRVPRVEVELWMEPHPRAAGAVRARYPDVGLRWQDPGELGDRLRGAFRKAFEEGSERALVVGSDHPTLPPGYLASALDALDDGLLALGPTEDGGYYALALHRRAWPAAGTLFREIPWSTGRVFEATCTRAREIGLEPIRLASWYDVDEPRSLERLRGDATPMSSTARALDELLGGG
ncbi:MAG: TIGR04282 family arsenosugar biosynthesis glycosyltransferase [Gemmatimonadota bacterium]